jgi:hypothetical protein
MSRRGKSIEIEGRLVIARGYRGHGDRRAIAK